MTRTDWDAGLEGYYADHDEIRLDADARGPALLLAVETEPAGCGRSGRPCTTRPATTTG